MTAVSVIALSRIAKDASERAGKSAGVAPELLFASILWALQDASKQGAILALTSQPAGWKLVPEEPTPEMLRAAWWLGNSNWEAILAAAPIPDHSPDVGNMIAPIHGQGEA